MGASKKLIGYNINSGSQQVDIDVEAGTGFFEILTLKLVPKSYYVFMGGKAGADSIRVANYRTQTLYSIVDFNIPM